MCDCYDHRCSEAECDTLLPIHISDFCMGRDDIAVFCGDHIPSENVTVFEVTEIRKRAWMKHLAHYGVKNGWKMGIRYLVEKPEHHEEPATPNLGADYKVTVI